MQTKLNFNEQRGDSNPPAYSSSNSTAIFIRDEKRAAVTAQEMSLLAKPKSTMHTTLGLPTKAFLLLYTALITIFNVIAPISLLQRGQTLMAGLSMISALVSITGFTALMLEKKSLLKVYLIAYTGYLFLASMLSAFAMINLWGPNFCQDFVASEDSELEITFEYCKNNLAYIRALGSLMMMMQLLFEFSVLRMIQGVYTFENSKNASDEQVRNDASSFGYVPLNTDEEKMVGFPVEDGRGLAK